MNRTIVITGASSGVGAAAARHVADFSRLSDVHELAGQLAKLDRIDVLANNAGGIFRERTLTEDGHETTLQVNHLAPFLLTRLLMPKLVASGASVINTSSAAQYGRHLDLDDLLLERRWTPMRAYGRAKLANVLFTKALHKHHVLDGVYAAAFHPGVVATAFGSDLGGMTSWFYGSTVGGRIMLTPEQGADTLVWLAQRTAPRDWTSGEFYIKRRVARPNRQALDSGLVEAFYQRSIHLVEG